MRNFVILTVVGLLSMALTGCGIIGGAGQDISSAGHAVTKSANAVKHTISY